MCVSLFCIDFNIHLDCVKDAHFSIFPSKLPYNSVCLGLQCWSTQFFVDYLSIICSLSLPSFLLTKKNKFIRRLSLPCTSGRRDDLVLLDINRISLSCKSACTFICRFFYVSNVASRFCFAFGTFVFFLRVNPLSLFWGF